MLVLNQIVNKRRVVDIRRSDKGYSYTVECVICAKKAKGVEISLRRVKCSCVVSSKKIGKTYGFLTILSWHRTNGRHKMGTFKCKCVCGKIVNRSAGKFCPSGRTRNNRNSCGYCSRLGSNSVRWTGVGEMPGTYVAAIKGGAKTRGIVFNITKEYMYDLYLKQDKKCAYTGLTLKFVKGNKGWRGASLDRIDSTKGYIQGNVQWVIPSVNIIKMDYTSEEFVNTCKLVVNYQKRKEKKCKTQRAA